MTLFQPEGDAFRLGDLACAHEYVELEEPMILHEFWLEVRACNPTSAEEPAAGVSLYIQGTTAHSVDANANHDGLCDQLLDKLIADFREPDYKLQMWPELFRAVELRLMLPVEKTQPHLRPIKAYESFTIQKRYMPEWLNFQRQLVKDTLTMWLRAQVMPTEPFFKRVLPPVTEQGT